MNTKNLTQEQISAFADGEFADVDLMLAALRDPESRANWDVYHQIGDALRSDDMAFTLSADFSARMAARLDAELPIIASVMSPVIPLAGVRKSSQSIVESSSKNEELASTKLKRFSVFGVITAAAAAIVCVTTPQLLVAIKNDSSLTNESITVASKDKKILPSTSSAGLDATVANPAQEAVVLRDPRIDDYLLAHQRFSPSVYNIAQYARSATFTTDSDK